MKITGYVKIAGSENGYGYEPSLYILNETGPQYKGMSYIIPLSSLHKYVRPFVKDSDPGVVEQDRRRHEELKVDALAERERLSNILLLSREYMWQVEETNRKVVSLIFAETLMKTNGILLNTGFSLGMLMQMFSIPPQPNAAAQLLLFIEDSLDDLKNMPPTPDQDKMMSAGNATLLIEGKKVYSGDWQIPQSDVVMERYAPVVPGSGIIQ